MRVTLVQVIGIGCRTLSGDRFRVCPVCISFGVYRKQSKCGKMNAMIDDC